MLVSKKNMLVITDTGSDPCQHQDRFTERDLLLYEPLVKAFNILQAFL